MKERDEIDLFFLNALDGLELNPDAYVKENINSAIISRKKRKRFLFIMLPLVFGACCLSTLLLLFPASRQKAKVHSELRQRKDSSENITVTSESSALILTHELAPQVKQITTGSPVMTMELKNSRFHSLAGQNSVNSIPEMNNFIGSENGSLLLTNDAQKQKGAEILNGNSVKFIENQDLFAMVKKNQDTLSVVKSLSNSTNVSIKRDSASVLSEGLATDRENSPKSGKWSISVLTYWEGEKNKTPDLSSLLFVDQKREGARISSGSFYGKIELDREIISGLKVLGGIGFRSSTIHQSGYLEILEYQGSGTGAGVPQPISMPDTVYSQLNQVFKVNSLVLPIGLAFKFNTSKNSYMQLSGGAECSFGKLVKKQLDSELSTPDFRTFGFSLWFRPEFHYYFGKLDVFVFGDLNGTLYQQLKWNIEVHRNPALGAGLGLRMSLMELR